MPLPCASTPQPSGDTMPMPGDDNPPFHMQHSSQNFAAHNKKPVGRSTTARPGFVGHRPAGASAFSRSFFQKFGGQICRRQDCLGGHSSGIFQQPKLFFKLHHELDGIECLSVGPRSSMKLALVDHFCRVQTTQGVRTTIFLNLARQSHFSLNLVLVFIGPDPPDDTSHRGLLKLPSLK